jgi:CheY-like chemotaxis protein
MERNPRYKILIVDDHEDNIELLRARLEARGYEVEGANDGQAALDVVDRWCPDLILLDVMMPKMDGMEVVRRLKAKTDRKELPFIPVIMQTALDSTENKVEGLESASAHQAAANRGGGRPYRAVAVERQAARNLPH